MSVGCAVAVSVCWRASWIESASVTLAMPFILLGLSVVALCEFFSCDRSGKWWFRHSFDQICSFAAGAVLHCGAVGLPQRDGSLPLA